MAVTHPFTHRRTFQPRPSRVLAAAIIITTMTSSAAAQALSSSPDDRDTTWARPYISQSVVAETSRGKIRGRLVLADGQQLVIDVPNPGPRASPRTTRTAFAMSDVRRVSAKTPDPIVDGILMGAAAALACLEWAYCGQGFDGQHTARDWSISVGLGALFGGGLDASMQPTQEIYRRNPDATNARRGSAIVLSVRF